MPTSAQPNPDIIAFGHDGVALSCAAKTCTDTGLSTLQRWLGNGKAEVLLLHNGKGKLPRASERHDGMLRWVEAVWEEHSS